MIKRLFIILLFMVGLLFNVSCDNITFEHKEPEKITVESGMAALEEVKNYSIKLDMKTIYDDESVEDMITVNIQVQDNVQKIELIESGLTYSFYTSTETKEDVEELYIIFDLSMLEMDYSGYVKVSLTEIKELIFGITTEDVKPGPGTNEADKLFTAFTDLTNFFTTLKNEYFDLVDVEDYYYVFNETGKTAFDDVMDEFIEVVSGDPTISEEIDIDVNITAQVDDKYITNFLIDLIGKNIDDGETEIIRIDAAFEKFGEVEVTLPTETITFEEFMELLQSGGSAEIA